MSQQPSQPNDQPELNLDQVEQLARVLTPIFRDALRPEFQELRIELRKANTAMGRRVTSLERLRWRMAGAIATVTFLIQMGWEWLRATSSKHP